MGHLLEPLLPHATTTGIVEVSHKRKQRELEATEHFLLFIVREAIVFISSKITFALFTCVQMHLAGVRKTPVSDSASSQVFVHPCTSSGMFYFSC